MSTAEREKERKWSHLVLFNSLQLHKCSLPGSSIHGIFQARILEWVAISFSRVSSQPKDWTGVSSTAGRLFTVWATREAPKEAERREGLNYDPVLPPSPKVQSWVWGKKALCPGGGRGDPTSPLPFATFQVTGLSSPLWCCYIIGFCDVADGPECSFFCLAALGLSWDIQHLHHIMCSISFAVAQKRSSCGSQA